MFRAREDRLFEHFQRTGNASALAQVFDRTAAELWRVAAHLCPQRQTAEDVVQATFLAAIEQADRWDNRRPLLPWLLGILANQTRLEQRRAGRRLDHDRLPARETPAADELAARSELVDVLAESLQKVPEVYRASLEQHLLSGRGAAEIAAEHGLKPGTVRMHLHRGMKHLRRVLPAGFAPASMAVGALSASAFARIRSGVLAHAGPAPTATATGVGAVFYSLLSVTFVNKTIVGFSLAALLGLLLWQPWDNESNLDSIDETRLPGHSSPNDRDVAKTPSRMSPVHRENKRQTPHRPKKGRVRIRIVTKSDRKPIQGLRFRWSVDRRGGYGLTDSTGVAVIEGNAGKTILDLEGVATKTRLQTHIVAGETRTQLFELPAEMHVEVVVVDRDGQPVANAAIIGRRDYWVNLSWGEIGRTDRTGKWRTASLHKNLSLGAIADGYAPARSSFITGGRGRTARATLVIGDPAHPLRGTVVDTRGNPVANARVVVQYHSERPRRAPALVLRTDARGRFATASCPAGPATLFALTGGPMSAVLGRGRRYFGRESVEVAKDGAHDVVIRLCEGATVYGQVRDSRGEPVSGGSVRASYLEAGMRGGLEQDLHISSSIKDDGSFRIVGLLPGHYKLESRIDDRSNQSVEVDLVDAQEFRWDPRLSREADWRFLVLGPTGKPIPQCRVSLTETANRGVHGARVESTDAEGRCAFPGLEQNEYTVRVLPKSVEFSMFARNLKPNPTENVLHVPATGLPKAKLKGRVVATGNLELRDFAVRIDRAVVVGSRHENESHRVRLDPKTGEFELGPLPPGTYHAIVTRGRVPMASVSGTVGQHDIDLGEISLKPPATLVVAASYADGKRVRDLQLHARLRNRTRYVALRGSFEKEGYTVQDLPRAEIDLLVTGRDMTPVRRAVSLRAGETERLMLTCQRGTTCTFSQADDGRKSGTTGARLTVRDSAGGVVMVGRLAPTRSAAPLRRGLAPGRYEVEVQVGEKRSRQQLVVRALDEQRIAITLP